MNGVGPKVAMCWVSIVLVLSTLCYDLCLARDEAAASHSTLSHPEERAVPEASVQHRPDLAPEDPLRAYLAWDENLTRTSLVQADEPPAEPDSAWIDWAPADTFGTHVLYDADGDSLPQSGGQHPGPIYKRLWFWAISIAALVLIAIVASGSREKSREELPGFPDPPER